MFIQARQAFFRKVVFLVLAGFVASFLVGGVTQAIMSAPEGWADHLVISEVQIYGDDAFDDFVELYNPTDQDLDLSTWSIQKTNSSGGALYRKKLSGTIPAYGYFLIVRNHADTDSGLVAMADVLASGTSFVLSNNYVVYLVNDNEDIEGAGDVNIVDLVGMGSAEIYEGAGSAVNPGHAESIERKSGTSHDEDAGNGYDTDNNNTDFVLRTISEPQNSQSDTEPTEEDSGGEKDEDGEDYAADHLVISEVQVYGASAYDDFVELYNPTDQDVDLSSWSVQKTNSTGGALYRKGLSGTIPAKGYFLVVRNHESTQSGLKDMADVLAAGSGLALSGNYVVYLVNDNEDIEGAGDVNIVDLVGMDTADIYEGTASAPGPGQGESIERKSESTHDEDGGNGYDTDDNANDFRLRTSPEPQNSGSSIEPAGEQDGEEEDGEDEEDQDGEDGDGEGYLADHLVISEAQIHGDSAYDDFVELYNPTDQDVDLSGWSVQKTNETGGGLYRKALSGTIVSHGYYLIVRNHTETTQTLKDMADVLGSASGFNLFDDNIVYLVNDNEDIEGVGDVNIVDMVGMGEADYYEGTQTAFNPDDGKSIERKSGPTHEWDMGNGYDTDENGDDFIMQDTPSPQNTQSAVEPVEDGEDEEEDGEEDQDGEGEEDQDEDGEDDGGVANYPVISEIQTNNITVYDDFVELYNPTDQDVDLSGWSVQKTNSTGGALYRKALSGTIPAYGYFLIVRNHENTQASLKDMADVLASGTSFTLASNYVVYLVNDNEDIEGAGDVNIVDLVGMDEAEIYEGSGQAPGPGQGESIERKSGPTHDENAGNGYDTDDNENDFDLRTSPEPQNSGSGSEPVEDGEEDGEEEDGEGEEDQDGEDGDGEEEDQEDGEDQEEEEEDQDDEEDEEDEGDQGEEGDEEDGEEEDEGDQADGIWLSWRVRDFEAIMAERQKEPKEPKFY